MNHTITELTAESIIIHVDGEQGVIHHVLQLSFDTADG